MAEVSLHENNWPSSPRTRVIGSTKAEPRMEQIGEGDEHHNSLSRLSERSSCSVRTVYLKLEAFWPIRTCSSLEVGYQNVLITPGKG